jgi:hypothetical protein
MTFTSLLHPFRPDGMTFRAPHETFAVDVSNGRISYDAWQLLCGKVGFVEASSVLRSAGVVVARRGEG